LIPWNGEGDLVELEDGRMVAACRGKDAVAVALELGVPVAGCIIHLMVAEYDSGPVVWRHEVEVQSGESYESLATRIHNWEDVGLPQVLNWFAQGRVRVEQGRAVIAPVSTLTH
ncbi:MAG: formyltransferase family protein, partial [Chloroflexi bacterium]|nr:formyltransferase family protein [Chloroflexota bacterium]